MPGIRLCMSGGGLMSAAFDAFLASVHPVAVEQERFGTPGRGERPGSAEDRLMRQQHAGRVKAFAHKRDYPTATPAALRAIVAESVAWDQEHEYKQSPQGRAAELRRRADWLENRKTA